MKILSSTGLLKLNEISDKYKFLNDFVIEQDDVRNFCQNISQAYYLGLNMDQDDFDFIDKILEDV